MDTYPRIPTKRIAIKLKPSAEKMVKRQHPWIFADSINKQNIEGNPGDLAIIFDSKKNNILAIGLYDPHSPIRVKILHFGKAVQINESWFLQTIKSAYDTRLPLLETETNSYRLLFGENDHMPGCIADVYADILVIKLYSSIWFAYLEQIVQALIEVSSCKVIVLRLSRSLQSSTKNYGFKDGQVLYGTLQKEVVIFKEHGVLFSANVIKGHKTGYFLDHRHNRKKVGSLSNGKKVLDVFSYAGGFSVHALTGGASEVVSLDISRQALALAKDNANLNSHAGVHNILVADAFEGLKNLAKQGEKFDIVVIDPPSFAKRESEIKRAEHSYERLVKLGVDLVVKGGILIMASCSSRIPASNFFKIVETIIIKSHPMFEIIDKTGHDIDHPIAFPEGAYLKCGYYRLH